MLIPTDIYRSKNFTASLSDDPSGIWFLDVSCKTEKNGVKGTVTGHIPLCLEFKENEDGSYEPVLSVMDEETELDDTTESKILQFGKKN